jgi:hypothetical protein
LPASVINTASAYSFKKLMEGIRWRGNNLYQC